MKPITLSNGSIIKTPLALAPMAGLTSLPFRQLLRELNPGAIGLFVSEFVSVEGLTRDNKPTWRMLRMNEGDKETPFAAQIFGKNIDRMCDAAKMIEDAGIPILDINAGCPAKKVVKKGGGSDLLRDLPLFGKILENVKKSISIPMTVKIRTGWDESSVNMLESAKIVEESGAEYIAVHGRTKAQGYKGESNWDRIKTVKEHVKIPVFGNGDIIDYESAKSRLELSNVDGLMIGRGVMNDPWLFSKVHAGLENKEYIEPTNTQKAAIFSRYRELLLEWELPEQFVLNKMKQLTVRLLRGRVNGAIIRTSALRSTTWEEFYSYIKTYFEI